MNRLTRILHTICLLTAFSMLSGCGFTSGVMLGAAGVGYIAYANR